MSEKTTEELIEAAKQNPSNPMIDAKEFLEGEIPHHFKVLHAKDKSYVDMSTVILIPTRGMIHYKPVSSWMSVIPPQNQKRALMVVEGAEVGVAYEKGLKLILEDEELSKFKYLMTIEDDNVIPSMAHLQLLQSMSKYKFDAMSGLYFAKGEFGFPMAFGDPDKWRDEKHFDCQPRDVVEAVQNHEVMEVNAIAMGCAVWRMDVFTRLKEKYPDRPLFKTWQEDKANDCYAGQTQDIYISQQIRCELGGRLGVDCRVKVGHVDTRTGEMW